MTEPSELRLVLIESDAIDEEICRAAREMAFQLNGVAGVDAGLVEGDEQSGGKGLPVEIGAILVKLAENATAIAGVLNVLKAWFERRPNLELVVQTKDGRQLTLKCGNVADAQKVLRSARGVLQG